MADRHWRHGDPTAPGAFTLRDGDREAYHQQDQAGRLEALARTMIAMPRTEAQAMSAAITKRHGPMFMDAVRSHVAGIRAAGICHGPPADR